MLRRCLDNVLHACHLLALLSSAQLQGALKHDGAVRARGIRCVQEMPEVRAVGTEVVGEPRSSKDLRQLPNGSRDGGDRTGLLCASAAHLLCRPRCSASEVANLWFLATMFLPTTHVILLPCTPVPSICTAAALLPISRRLWPKGSSPTSSQMPVAPRSQRAVER